MERVTKTRAFVAVSLLALASCAPDAARDAERTVSSTAAPPVSSPPDSGARGVHTPAELEAAATQMIGFLRGEVGFDRIRLAETVTLYVSPEGGGSRTTTSRTLLRDRSNWKVRGLGGFVHSLVPPSELTQLTTRVGRHLNCRERALSSIFAELAHFPHVGTMLAPVDASSCLQTRNLTLVFDPSERPPTLVAAVYDQWEW